MKPSVEIFSQGDEVITGQVVDTNAAWLAQRLTDMGFSVSRHTAVGDDLAALVGLLQEIAHRADCCLCTGGLGPTVDDLTAEAVSMAFEQPLQLDELALRQIETYFANRKRPMAAINRKQALLPATSVRIDNPCGTAPGFSIAHQGCWLAFMPGVPDEMKAMFEQSVQRQLQQRFQLHPDRLITLRCIGIAESDIQQCLQDMTWPAKSRLGFRASLDEVQIKLLFSAEVESETLDQCVRDVAACLGDFVFAIDGWQQTGGGLLTVVDGLMRQRQWRLSIVETTSHGLLAAKCLGYDWLQAAQVLPKSKTATDLAATLDLARCLRTDFDSELLLVQGYQGSVSDYQTANRAIEAYNVLLTPDGEYQRAHTLSGNPQRKQNQAALLAVDLLRRYLQHKA